jgi:hypothetical protein
VVTFRNATLGSLSARNAQLHNPGGASLSLTQAVVSGSVFLDDGFAATGAVVSTRAASQAPQQSQYQHQHSEMTQPA